jgi:3-oxoadipate enol-lactonase
MDIEALHYRIDGNGPNLLLLHPIGLDLTFFEPMVEELKPRYRILRIDMRGHGGTPPVHDGTDPWLEDYAADVHLLLQRLNFGPTAVVGFSFGGMIAQELTLNHPEDVNALVISGCPGTFNEDTRKALRERGCVAAREGMQVVIDTTMHRWFSAEFRARGADMPAQRRLLSNDVDSWKQAWRAISGLDTAPRLRSIKTPTLCLAAEGDISAPPPVVETVANAIPGAEFVVVSNTPHMLFIEQPERVSKAIDKFLRKVLRVH